MGFDFEYAVIGAGVVGLAVARSLACRGREVVVLESAETIGTGVSSRNSEVIHGGLYYPPGSLKARLCVAGRDMLYAYCAERGVAHRRTGKLVVATEPAEVPKLLAVEQTARANGVAVDLIDRAAALAMEPALRVECALHSPSTGIVDSHGLMVALRGEAEDGGAKIAFLSPVTGGAGRRGAVELRIGGADPVTIRCRGVVNCAGLGAQGVARSIEGVAPASVPRRYMTKGNYFFLSGKAPFSRLIYPVPEHAGLGVHLTIDLAGRTRFGPDVQWVEAEDYRPDPERAALFYTAVRRYWPNLKDGTLSPDYVGIRPKVQAPDRDFADFAIQDASDHGVAGLVNLYGIESPGLTAALPLGEEIAAALVEDRRPFAGWDAGS